MYTKTWVLEMHNYKKQYVWNIIGKKNEKYHSTKEEIDYILDKEETLDNIKDREAYKT